MEEFNASMSSVRTSVEWLEPYELLQVSRLQKISKLALAMLEKYTLFVHFCRML